MVTEMRKFKSWI